jgi:hypothetical protein
MKMAFEKMNRWLYFGMNPWSIRARKAVYWFSGVVCRVKGHKERYINCANVVWTINCSRCNALALKWGKIGIHADFDGDECGCPWITGTVECDWCGRRHVAVRPACTPEPMECSFCRCMTASADD